MRRIIETNEQLFAQYPYVKVLHDAAKKVPANGTIVELGCYYGKTTALMASSCKNGQKVYAVDHFNGTATEVEDFKEMNEVVKETFGMSPREVFEKNASFYPDTIRLLEMDFDSALSHFDDNSIDMIFFDGDHMTTYAELVKWWPKIKDGGVAYGHDIHHKKFTVREDIERFCSERGLKFSVPFEELFLVKKGKETLPHAYIVTMGHNTRKWAKACVLSVSDCVRYYPNLTHVIVDDWSDDGTWERYQQEDLRGPHQILVRPPQRTGSPLSSFMFGLSQVKPNPDDVIFWVDADDWLTDPKAVKIMMDVYIRNPVTEMAYSQHVWFHGKDKQATAGISQPIQEPTMVRPDLVKFSHLRTFRYRMLDHVPDAYLRQEDGEYWRTCGDSALYLPMLEATRKVAFINKVLYAYNQATGSNEWTAHQGLVAQNSTRIRSMSPNLNTRHDLQKPLRYPPVRRFKLDFGRACDIKCQGCYYLHQKDKFNLTLEQVEEVIIQGRLRGNRACDISGGEPTLYKDLPKWLELANKHGIAPGIITHGQRLAPMLDDLISAGLYDILFSVHGGEEAHNWWTQTDDGYAKQRVALERCAEIGFGFRTNTVLHSGYKSLPQMAKDLSIVKPYISNFINFNPYYEWTNEERPFQAKVSEIAPYLREAIDILTDSGTMVNVRYFPFCVLKGHEKHFVDMAQVMFDPYEWDYSVMPKTVERYNKYGVELASGTRAYSEKCATCSIGGTVCYGVNRVYLESFGDEELQPYDGPRVLDKFHFRQFADPRQLYTYIGHNYEWRFRNCA